MLRRLMIAAFVALASGASAGVLHAVAPPSSVAPAIQWKVDPDNLSPDHVPAHFAHLANPFAGQANAVRAGGKLFSRHCAECHGPDAQGTDRGPTLRARAVEEASPGVLYWFVTNGNLGRGMPAWSGLSPQRRWQLISYLESLEDER